MSKRIFLTALAAIVVSTISIAGQLPADRSSHRIVPIAPMTGDVEILHGDPDKPGEPFVIRIRELAGGIIPPHRHTVDEHITVVKGTLYFAIGDRFDRAQLREMKTGSYAFIPKGSIMFGYTPEEAVVQVHGIGPFKIFWRSPGGWHEGLKTFDSPDAVRSFKFERGELVSTPRGKGRIKQGYDSGEIIGYEIEGDDGTLFMAEECEIVVVGPERKPKVDRPCFSGGNIVKEQKHARH